MNDLTIINQIVALIKQAAEQEVSVAMDLAATEYARGRADERVAILQAIGVKVDAAVPVVAMKKDSATTSAARSAKRADVADRDAGERKRAPKGMVRFLVNKALVNGVRRTSQDILDCAETDLERMVKPASIRSELRAGFEEGIYGESRGQWFLTKGGEVLVGTEGAPHERLPSVPTEVEKGGDIMPPP